MQFYGMNFNQQLEYFLEKQQAFKKAEICNKVVPGSKASAACALSSASMRKTLKLLATCIQDFQKYFDLRKNTVWGRCLPTRSCQVRLLTVLLMNSTIKGIHVKC